ncbi:Flavocytochrome c [Amniculicola lignicola CBS 123094]|uniref:Fumarate reductase n=1 Tax=Amniculicola lignicola CBS 123094 TaxID=1392246 RepID=A0A6A5W093_9PLEO|nr:Flavocytochrome c [Amniculicola lignicola CBS 123094]
MPSSPILPISTPAPKAAIIVGSGLAGLSAASQLLKHNIPIHLLERAPKPGGNSIKASSGINGSPTKYQPKFLSGPDDAFYSDTVKSAGQAMSSMTVHRERLIATLTNESAGVVDWLVQQGVDLSRVAQLGGHSNPRTHRGAGNLPPGASIITTLLKSLQESPLFHLQTSCTVTKVLGSGNRVTGVEITSAEGEKSTLYGPVIFAAGGFAGDAQGMLAQYRPDLGSYPSTNEPRPGMQSLLTAVGAKLVDMELVQVHPTGFMDPKDPTSPVKFLAAELLRGEGGILLVDGKRFVNELDTREHITDVITKMVPASTLPKQWDVQLVLDEGIYKMAKSHIDFYVWKGLMRKTTISDLGPTALGAIQEYAKVAAGSLPDHFGRTSFANWTLTEPNPDSVIYVGTVTPVIHFTMGGALINENSEVFNDQDTIIEGLWAAGEITGGVHGGNRLGGSSLLECVVFGRRAGDACAAYLGTREE